HSSEQWMAVRDPQYTRAVRDMIDRAGHGRDEAEIRRSRPRELARLAGRPDRLDAAHLCRDTHERGHLARVPAEDGDIDLGQNPLRRLGAKAGRARADGVEDDGNPARAGRLPG